MMGPMRARLSREDRVLGVLSRVDGDASGYPALAWGRLFRRSVRERTAGIVSASIDRLGIAIPPGVAEAFRSVRTRLLAVHVLRAVDRDDVLGALDGIPVIQFKGLDLVDRAYRLAGIRDMADLDLLVRPGDVGYACAVLAEMGWRSPIEPARAVALGSGRTVNSLMLVHPERTPVHLHWHFANASLPLPYAGVSAEEVFKRSDGPVLDPEGTYVLVCEHALKHSFSALLYLSDVSAVWTGLKPDPSATIALGRRWGVEMAVRYASILARELLGAPIDDCLTRRTGIRGEGRILLRSALSGRRWNGLSALGFLSMHREWRAKWRFFRGALAPSDGDVELFGKQSGGRVVRRAWRALSMIAGGLIR